MPVFPRTRQWWPQFELAAAQFAIDPFLLAAICDRESHGGAALTPPGPEGKGDGGHGHGLMQIDDRFWGSWLRTHRWWDPGVNICKGAEIYLQGLRACGGDEVGGIGAYNAGPGRASRALIGLPRDASLETRIAAVDRLTTGRDYVSDVLRRMKEFKR